eukprot:997154-Rhodomonas_salina.1
MNDAWQVCVGERVRARARPTAAAGEVTRVDAQRQMCWVRWFDRGGEEAMRVQDLASAGSRAPILALGVGEVRPKRDERVRWLKVGVGEEAAGK